MTPTATRPPPWYRKCHKRRWKGQKICYSLVQFTPIINNICFLSPFVLFIHLEFPFAWWYYWNEIATMLKRFTSMSQSRVSSVFPECKHYYHPPRWDELLVKICIFHFGVNCPFKPISFMFGYPLNASPSLWLAAARCTFQKSLLPIRRRGQHCFIFFFHTFYLCDIWVSSVDFVPQLALLMLSNLLVIFFFFFFCCCFLQTNWKHILFPVKTCQTRSVWTGEWKSFHEPTIGGGRPQMFAQICFSFFFLGRIEPHANHMKVSQQRCGRVVFADLIWVSHNKACSWLLHHSFYFYDAQNTKLEE